MFLECAAAAPGPSFLLVISSFGLALRTPHCGVGSAPMIMLCCTMMWVLQFNLSLKRCLHTGYTWLSVRFDPLLRAMSEDTEADAQTTGAVITCLSLFDSFSAMAYLDGSCR